MSITLLEIIQLLSMISAVVWIVASVKASTLRLGATIDGLKDSVNRLQSWLETHANTLNNHEGRIANLEGRNEVQK
jgi:hypothetical protein